MSMRAACCLALDPRPFRNGPTDAVVFTPGRRSAVESEHMKNVMANPAFQSDPVGAVMEHVKNLFELQRQKVAKKE